MQVRPNIVPPILQSILFENIHMPAAALYLGFRFLDNGEFASLGHPKLSIIGSPYWGDCYYDKS
jgi:hypothetical protein